MTPLTTWTCDTCHEAIQGGDRGIVVWLDQTDTDIVGPRYDFRIVHKLGVNPEKNCDPENHTEGRRFIGHIDLSRLLGVDGLSHLLSLLGAGPVTSGVDEGVRDFSGYVDLVRRLQTPYYEEARPRLRRDQETRDRFHNANEYYPYTQEVLKSLAEGRSN